MSVVDYPIGRVLEVRESDAGLEFTYELDDEALAEIGWTREDVANFQRRVELGEW